METRDISTLSKYFILVGTKKDLRNNFETIQTLESKKQKPITYDQGKQLAQEIGAVNYWECSAFTLDGVDEIFDQAVRIVLSRKIEKNKHRSRTCTIQ
jgi:GTPase SAR1 family protein